MCLVAVGDRGEWGFLFEMYLQVLEPLLVNALNNEPSLQLFHSVLTFDILWKLYGDIWM